MYCLINLLTQILKSVKSFNKKLKKCRDDKSKGTRLEKGKEQEEVTLAKVKEQDGNSRIELVSLH